jgi:HipA-like kinase
MIVKAKGLPEITESKLFNEVFGNLLAQELGITTPTPCLVEISSEFLAANKPNLSEHHQRVQSGLAVATERLEGLLPIPSDAQLSPDELSQAALIYAFDLLVQNPDRRVDNPNCARHGDRLVAYDFEMSFSFILAILGKEDPWEVSKHGINDKHMFRSALRRTTRANWRYFIRALESLTDERLNCLDQGLPDSWKQNLTRILGHICDVRSHLSEFELELQRSLT